MKRVVITGLGAVTPIGQTVKEYWHSLINGVSGTKLITKFNASKFKTRFACEIENFEPNIFENKERRKYDLYTQYALVSVEEAIQQSKLDFDGINKNRVGVIWGAGDGGVSTFEEQMKEYFAGDGT